MEALLLWYGHKIDTSDGNEGRNGIRLTGCMSTTGTQGLIFVIDSNDRSRIDEARQELHRIILDREMKEALLLVFANKQDIQGGEGWLHSGLLRANADGLCEAMTPQEVQERLKLNQLKDKVWYVVPSCATTGEGLFEGLVRHTSARAPRPSAKTDQGWLSNNVKTPPQRQAR